MAVSVIQSSFSAGEISRNLFARVDLDKYHSGAALMRNFFVDYRGGASTRPGTESIAQAKGQTYTPRVIQFIFSQTQSYVIELGDLYARFYTNGEVLLNAGTAISMILNSVPCEVTSAAHGLATGQWVFISGVLGMTELNGKFYIVTVLDANTIQLHDLNGAAIDATGFGAYTGGGLVSAVYELVTPYAAADLRLLKFVQSADVMTITHPSYTPHNLSRTSPSTFTLAAITVGPALPAPTIASAVPTDPGDLTYQYVVCAVTADGERGTPSAILSADSKALDPTPTAGAAVAIQLGYSFVTGADHYDIFKNGPTNNLLPLPTYFGYVGSTTDAQWTDSNIAPDYATGPPTFRDPFSGGKNPGCVSYFQQRRAFGNIALSSPEELEFSRVGAYANFDVSGLFPIDSDAISINIASRQVNAITSMVPTSSGLIVFTSGGGFLVSGGTPAAAISPSNVVALPQASGGANNLPPIQVNYDILYVQNKGANVRDLTFQWQTQSFFGFDRSTLSSHLFFGWKLLEWAWAEEPFKVVWAVRSDGHLLSLTYVPEQEIYGWAQHDTQGFIGSVCSVPEGDEDRVYTVTQRESNGAKINFIERMASRHVFTVEDSWSVDCGVEYVLTPGAVAIAIDVTDGVVTLTALSGTPFSAPMVGDWVWLTHEVGGGAVLLTGFTSATVMTGTVQRPLGNLYEGSVPQEYYAVPAGMWEYGPPVSVLDGLDHLAGQSVSCVADGQSVGPLTVSASGGLTLPAPATKIVAGLPFTARLQTLDLDTGDPTIQGRRKLIPALTLRLDTALGLRVGRSFTKMNEIKYKRAVPYTPPQPLVSDDERIIIEPGWTKPGVMCVEQTQPFPATVLGVIAEVTLGDTQT